MLLNFININKIISPIISMSMAFGYWKLPVWKQSLCFIKVAYYKHLKSVQLNTYFQYWLNYPSFLEFSNTTA